jgi:hypothetical protein
MYQDDLNDFPTTKIMDKQKEMKYRKSDEFNNFVGKVACGENYDSMKQLE